MEEEASSGSPSHAPSEKVLLEGLSPSRPLGSRPPLPPAAVFLIEARCGPDALGGNGGQGQAEDSIPGPLPPQGTSRTEAPGTVPALREPPPLLPELLAAAPSEAPPVVDLYPLGIESLGQQPLQPHLSPHSALLEEGQKLEGGGAGGERREDTPGLAQRHAQLGRSAGTQARYLGPGRVQPGKGGFSILQVEPGSPFWVKAWRSVKENYEVRPMVHTTLL